MSENSISINMTTACGFKVQGEVTGYFNSDFKSYFPVIQTNYMGHIYRPDLYSKLIKDLTALMKHHEASFKTIAFSGMSGAAVAYPVGLALDKHLTCVRKEQEGTHYLEDRSAWHDLYSPKEANVHLEGRVDKVPYCIVDDFVETGKTIKYIRQQMGRQPVAVFLYWDDGFCPEDKLKKFDDSWSNVPFYKL